MKPKLALLTLLPILVACTAPDIHIPAVPTSPPILISSDSSDLAPTHTSIIEIRINHVRDLAEILVKPGDTVEVGQKLAELSGYAGEISWEVQLAEAYLDEAQARLDLAYQDAISAHKQAVAEAKARVEELALQLATLERQKQIANAELAQAHITTEYRQRWIDILLPLRDFDPWGDLPYLVGAQSGPQGPRSDLAYREALATAEYHLRIAEMAETIARIKADAASADFLQAQADLEAAQTTLEYLQASPLPSACSPLDEALLRISKTRLFQTRARLEETTIRSLIAGRVVKVSVSQVTNNEATVIVTIATAEGEKE